MGTRYLLERTPPVSLQLFRNGVLQALGVDFTITEPVYLAVRSVGGRRRPYRVLPVLIFKVLDTGVHHLLDAQ